LIAKLLVANRGEIARRIFRTCRELGISSVAVYSDADADLPYVREADASVHIGPGPAAESYLDVERVLAAAAKTGADSIHPGYGFLSEDAGFAAAVVEAGLTWVGPSPDSIRAMGDKATARRMAAEHNVPTVPGYDGDDQQDATFASEAARIGFPLLVKAAGGGGGRGMRRVHAAGELQAAVDSARREAGAAFGNDKLLLERLIERARHIEVQVFGDGAGQVVHLFERECSVQRRHQKVVEEAPSPGVDAALRQELGAAAVRIASAVNYAGAGTVEFLLNDDGSFYFLEMNTRLQVEHPVTELVTSTDLVAAQIAVAEGRGLPWQQDDIELMGHAIEVRVYAEDPMRDYMPGTGALTRFDLPADPGVRIDAGFESGNVLGPHYDAMLAKVIAWGGDRAEANRRLQRAVNQAWIPGVITNLPLLRQLCANPAWQQGQLHTGFLNEHPPVAPPLNFNIGVLHAVALDWWSRRVNPPWGTQVAAGFRVEGNAADTDTWRCGTEEATSRATELDANRLSIEVDDSPAVVVQIFDVEGDEVTLAIGSVRRTSRVVQTAETTYVHFGDGEAFVQRVPRFAPPAGAADEPGSCTAPTPGTVVAIKVAEGDSVTAGQTLIVLEAMKMEHQLTAPEDGVVASVRVEIGDAVDQGTLLLKIEPNED